MVTLIKMKKPLLIIFLFFAYQTSVAQSLTFADLINLTGQNNEQAHDFLTTGKGFKQSGGSIADGQPIEEYKSNRPVNKIETVEIGKGAHTYGGNTLRVVTYTTLNQQDIINLIAEAKKSTLTLVFTGADQNNNIYRFDNSLYRVNITLSFDKKTGTVEVQQKQFASN